MKKIIFSLIISIIFLKSSDLSSQIKEFSSDPNEFIKQFKEEFMQSPREEVELLYKELQKSKLTALQQSELSNHLNALKEAKVPSHPYLVDIVTAFLYKETSQVSQNFKQNWTNTLDQIAKNYKKGNNQVLKQFIDFSTPFFAERLIYSSKSKNYIIESDNPKLEIIDNTLWIHIPNTTLKGYFKHDTMAIYNTSGIINCKELIYIGNQGESNWERVAIPKQITFATYGKFAIDLRLSDLEVDSVKLTYLEYFPKPIYGFLKDKITKESDYEKINYPQFTSYEASYNLNNVVSDNVLVQGAFKIIGGKAAVGATKQGEPANILINHPKTKKRILSAYGNNAYFEKDRYIKLNESRIVIYTGKDSIVHPFSSVKYDVLENKIDIICENFGSGKSRFMSSFHQMNFDAEQITWNLDSTILTFKLLSGQGISPTVFVSQNNFDVQTFSLARTAADRNPLTLIRELGKSEPNGFPIETLNKAFGENVSNAQSLPLVFTLEKEGFLSYDALKKRVLVHENFTDFYIKASSKKVDFDQIRFKSKGQNHVTQLNLENNSLYTPQVTEIPLNDSALVKAFPTSVLEISKNKAMRFDGDLLVGRLDVTSKNIKFNYDSFQLSFDSASTITPNIPIAVNPSNGQEIVAKVKSSLTSVNAKIQINSRVNRSGMQSARQFPKIEVFNKPRITYDKPYIHQNAYNDKKFYFEIEPFKMDSLNYFSLAQLKFQGKLYSDSIFPVFSEQIRLYEDTSLGFDHVFSSPQTNYKNKGKFQGQLSLSNRGLLGNGTQSIQSINFIDDALLFLPQTMKSNVNSLASTKQTTPIKIPNMSATDIDVFWRPYSDSLIMRSNKENPIYVFDSSANFAGNLIMTQKELKGNGLLDFEDALISSSNFKLSHNAIKADTATLQIKSLGSGKSSLKTENVTLDLNFDNGKADFKSNDKDILANFEQNKFMANADNFNWDMKNKTLEFTSKNPLGTEFKQTTSDPISFYARKSIFDMKSNSLKMNGVGYIPIADSRVYPKDSFVEVSDSGHIKTLNQAEIDGDTSNFYHYFDRVTIDIHSNKDFIGRGFYTINVQGKDYPIEMYSIAPVNKKDAKGNLTKEYTVVGKGNVKEEEQLKIYQNTDFYGAIQINVSDNFTYLEGAQRLNFQNPKYTTPWFPVADRVNISQYFLNKPKLLTQDSLHLQTGIFYDRNSEEPKGLYTLMLKEKPLEEDVECFRANGVISHSKDSGYYLFGDSTKVMNRNMKGNVLIYNDKTADIRAIGVFDPKLQMSGIELVTSGELATNLHNNTYSLNTNIGLSLKIDQSILNAMAVFMMKLNAANKDIKYFDNATRAALFDLFSDKDNESISKDIKDNLVPSQSLKSSKYNLLLTNVSMTYDPEDKSFRSKGDFGLALLGNNWVNKFTSGFVEFGFGEYTDNFTLYFKGKGNFWMYMNYLDGSLSILTTDMASNSALEALDEKKRTVKSKEESYKYIKADMSEVQDFVKRMSSGGKSTD
jgi:hypothetical protein